MVGKILKNNKGSVLIEVALMFLVVTMLTVGYLYFTQAMRMQTVAQIAAREGARVYAITNNPVRARERIRAELALGRVDPDDCEILIRKDGSKRIVSVQIKRGFYVPAAGEYNLNLRGGAEYILENNPEIEEKGQL